MRESERAKTAAGDVRAPPSRFGIMVAKRHAHGEIHVETQCIDID